MAAYEWIVKPSVEEDLPPARSDGAGKKGVESFHFSI